ncbi:MAG TPA: zinc ribbon domain-containing protein [Streptosporangiales bacterium]
MAEIVCPHCHASVPRDGAFCPQCRSFIGRSAGGEYEPAVAVAAAGEADAVQESGARAGAARAAVAKDLFEEAVRSSMAASGPTRERARDRAAEAEDDGPDPYPSDTELAPPGERRRRRTAPRLPETGERPGALARAIVWLVRLPARTRTSARRLGPMPVTVAVVVLALLASGGLLYSVGAFDRQPASGQRSGQHAAAVHALTPATYRVSCSAPPSVDSAGNRVTFGAGHLVDGRTTTAWRCAGDGHSQRVTLTFARPVRVSRLALVPGWATKDRTSKANRFAENGAPTVVTWYVGTTPVKQRLGKPHPRWAVQRLQTPITSRTVTLTIDAVRKGNLRATVAVSEVRVYGR